MVSREQHKKLTIPLRYWMQGRGWNTALRALEFAARHHTGTRKDGATPEFHHQIVLANFARAIEAMLLHPERTVTVLLLHDVVEDYDVRESEVAALFGEDVTASVMLLTARANESAEEKYARFQRMATDPVASVAKAIDRYHNLQSMIGVFPRAKQEAYAAEVETYFLPMLKAARRSVVEQEGAYELLKLVLRTQVEWVRAMHQAADRAGGARGDG